MERWQRTVIGHRDQAWCNPLGWALAGPLHAAARLREGARILDLACGKGALAVYLADWTPEATAVGVERIPEFVEAARALADEEGVQDRVRFEEADAAAWQRRQRGFDLAACVGARPWGDLDGTLAALVDRVRPGGVVVAGEVYWRCRPDPGYLELLGCGEEDCRDLHGTLRGGLAASLDPVFWMAATQEQLDAYEQLLLGNLLEHARRRPRDAQAQALAADARRWRDGYLRWGRDTLGFVVAAWRC